MEPSYKIIQKQSGVAEPTLSKGENFLIFLQEVQATVKVLHLESRSRNMATHQHLGVLYDELNDLLDPLIETYMGINGPIKTCICSKDSVEDVPMYLRECFNTIENTRNSIMYSFLQSQIDLIQQSIAHCLYRLNFVKC